MCGALWFLSPGFDRLNRRRGVGMEREADEQVVERLAGEFVALREKALRRDGTIGLRLIGPGWGSSGYYPAETLRRDGPQVFRSGMKMYWNHPTASEESERPEGDLRDLAAVLVSDARWEEAGQAGPGLYADAKLFEGYTKAVEELAPHIGVSIRGSGRASSGEAEGRQGTIISALTSGRSVDFVTEPGAGGRIVQLFEAARTPTPSPSPITGEGSGVGVTLAEARNVGEWMEARLHHDFTVRADEMFGEGYLTREERIILSSAIGDALEVFRATVEAKAPHLYQRDIFAQPSGDNTALAVGVGEGVGMGVGVINHARTDSGGGNVDELEKVKGELETAQAQVAALEAALLGREAEGVVREALAQAGLPGVSAARLQRACVVNPPVGQEGKLDVAGLRQRVSEAVAAETKYLQEAAGWGGSMNSTGGRIEGMGSGQGAGGAVDMAVVEKRLSQAFADLGFATAKREG